MKPRTRTLTRSIGGAIGVTLLVVLVLWMSGTFSPGRIAPGRTMPPPPIDPPSRTAVAESRRVPTLYRAVGTVRSRLEAHVAPQVTGRIVTVDVDAGHRVEKGALLATLESDSLRARVEAARSAEVAARASSERARLEHDRVRRLFESDAATQAQLEAADAADKEAAAALEAARQGVAEAEVSLGFTRVVAPIAGVVAERAVDPGDLAWPGRTLIEIHDPRVLRLEAHVREGLIASLEPGAEVNVRISAANAQLTGRLEEIVPSADPVSRSFLVKVRLPVQTGVYPGMFGELELPIGDRDAITIPRAAVRTVGQLDTVLTLQGDRWTRRYVTLGPERGDDVEVLSGLSGNDTIGLPESDVDG